MGGSLDTAGVVAVSVIVIRHAYGMCCRQSARMSGALMLLGTSVD